MAGLNDAVEQIVAGEREPALASLLAAWRVRPLARLADAIDELDATLPRADVDARDQDAWLKGAKAAKEPALGAYLAATFAGGSLEEKRARVELLAGRKRDPRIATALLAVVRDVPFTSNTSRPAWNAIFALLDTLDDPRVPAAAEAARAGWTIRANQREWLEGKLAKLLAAYEDREAPAPTADEEKALAKIEQALGAGAPRAPKKDASAEDLLAAIYDAPDDDGPRLVYADHLLEKGDDRGEFIALQIRGGDPKRQAKLLKPNAQAWAGPLAPVLLKDGLEYRRGFVAACRVKFKNERDARAHGAYPAWATVETLDHSETYATGQDRFIWWIHPAMKSLRDVNLGGGPLDDLLAAPPWKIERLRMYGREPERVRAVAESEKLPLLVRFGGAVMLPQWLTGTTLAGRLVELIVGRLVENHRGEAIDWTRAAAAFPKLELLTADGGWRVTRDANGDFSVATVDDFGAGYLGWLPADALTSLTIAGTAAKQGLKTIVENAQKQTRLEKLDLTAVGGEVMTFARAKAPRAPAAERPEEAPLRLLAELSWPVADRIVGRNRDRIVVIDPVARSWRAAGEVYNAAALATSPDGKLVAVADGMGKKIVVRSLDEDRVVASIAVPAYAPQLAFLPDGKRLLAAGNDATLRVWRAEDGQLLSERSIGRATRSFALLDEHRVALAIDRLAIVEIAGAARVRAVGERGWFFIAAAPDGRIAAGGPQLRLFSPELEELAAFDVPHTTWLRFVDGERLAVRAGGQLKVLRVADGAELTLVKPDLASVCVSPDGTRLAVALSDRVEIWPTADAAEPLATIH